MAKFQTPTVPDTQETVAVRSHDRDDDQKAIDAKVEPLVDAWTKAGKPSKLTGEMTDRLQVKKDDRVDVVKMVRRAFTLYKADPLWYTPTQPDADGWVIIKFGPQPQKPKTPKATEAVPATTPPAATPPADTPKPTPPADDAKRSGLLGARR